jgi:hypothetical protein
MATLVGSSWAPASSSKHKDQEEVIENWWEEAAQPLVARCMRKHNWKLTFAQRCLKGYRQFMELKTVMNDWKDKQLVAPIAVLMMWEEHILDSMNYAEDCVLLFGHTIGHNPDVCLDERAVSDRIRTTKIAFQARFADDMDCDIWDWGDIENGMNEAKALGVNCGSAPNTPAGRLPVAPGTRVPARHITLSEDSDDTPQKYTRSSSPARRAVSPTRGRTTTPEGNDPLTIYLKDKEGDQTYFSLRYRIPFRVMFAVYAERKDVDQEKLVFTYNGKPLTGFETPYSVGMEEGEHIDVAVNEKK